LPKRLGCAARKQLVDVLGRMRSILLSMTEMMAEIQRLLAIVLLETLFVGRYDRQDAANTTEKRLAKHF
jgi:hypothetical protein